jgi:hypothetical protein
MAQEQPRTAEDAMAISRRTLIERIDRFIRSIENHKGQPDHWEGHCTLQALTEVNEGDIERAEAKLILARTPPALREPQDKASVPADGRAPTAAELRLELERIKSHASTSSL